MTLELVAGELSVVRLSPIDAVPAWALRGEFFSITRSPDELSVVCLSSQVPAQARAEGPWRAFKVQGPLDFALTGILYSLAAPLAAAGIPIFAISTFDTDYLLVRATALDSAISALEIAKHQILRC